MTPNFSAYPFDRLRRMTRRDAAFESAIARWVAARGHGSRLAKLVGQPVVPHVVEASRPFDPYAASCAVRIGGATIDVRGSSAAVRRITQRLLGGPPELAAARPLTIVERSIWALVVATAVEDLGIVADVWPHVDDASARGSHAVATPNAAATIAATPNATVAATPTARANLAQPNAAGQDAGPHVVEVAIDLDVPLAVQLTFPRGLELRVPPARPAPAWTERAMIDVPIVVGRCAVERTALDRLALRNVITLEPPMGNADLDLLGGRIGLKVSPNAVVAEVSTGYVPRDMSLPDDAHVELAVALGTTQLSLRQVFDLAIGQVVPLGRPLAGPFELRAAGRVVGKGELVNVDGELAVRIVSLGDQ